MTAHRHPLYCCACGDSIGICHVPTAHHCPPKFCVACKQDAANDIEEYLGTGIYYTQAETHAALAGTLNVWQDAQTGEGR